MGDIMAKFRNAKPGIIGYSLKAETGEDGKPKGPAGQRTVGPGEIFEAEKSDIPEHYFTQGWIVEAKDSDANAQQQQLSATADVPLNPKYDGPNPTQQSGTSVNKSETDKAAQDSGAYLPPKTTTDTTEGERKKR
jgi:hypothetical protein